MKVPEGFPNLAALDGVLFDRDGKPIDDFMDYLLKCGDDAYRIVARDDVGDLTVSTIWIGMDIGAGFSNGRPYIFETIVFNPDGSATNRGRRYCTEMDARAGHAAYVIAAHDMLRARALEDGKRHL